jgi:hypothetical protein
MLVARTLSLVGHVGCTYHWHNRHSGRKSNLCIPPPIARGYLAEVLITLRVSKAHWFKIKVHLKSEICQMELDRFENIPVVYCSEDI